MASFSFTTKVNAPLETVFQLFSDIEHAAGRIKAITKVEMLTPGPVKVGTRFRETRIVFKREATEEMEFVAYEPNRRYSLGCDSCGMRYLTTFDFEPDGAGTQVRLTFTAKARSVFAWLMAPLGWLMKGMIRKCIQGDIAEMKALAEKQGQAASLS